VFENDGDDRLTLLEALLFASDKPQPQNRLVQYLGKSASKELTELIGKLNEAYANEGRTFRIRRIAGGYQMYLLPTFTRAVEGFLRKQRERKLSQAALETLSIIAYKQPVTKADVEHIRGVNSDGVMASLLERKLIAITGRSSKVGRALLYGTTTNFLEYFGLDSLEDLPKLDEIQIQDASGGRSDDQVELELSESDNTYVGREPATDDSEDDFESNPSPKNVHEFDNNPDVEL